MKTVAVLGGGGTGCMIAADNALRGNDVRLWEDAAFYHENLADVQAAGGIEVTGNAITGFAQIPLLTTDMKQAVTGADVILIAAVAHRHLSISRELAPLLVSGQAVCFSAGNTSSIPLKKMLGPHQDVVVGEMSGNCYPSRMEGKAKVSSAFPYKQKNVAAFPAADNDRLVAALKGVYDCTAIQNVLEATLNSPNVVVHLAGSLLNTGGIDKNPDFKLYTDGLTPHTLKVMEQVEAEKIRVMEAMGYHPALHVPMMGQVMDYSNFPELERFRVVSGPSSMDHRYITEDAVFGQSILLSLAEAAGIPVPLCRSLVILAGAVNGVDYLSTGVTLETLGMSGLDSDGINHYLLTGNRT